VTDLTVTVNGAVTSTYSAVTRLEWQWGDGESDLHQWFPPVHTYAASGTYPITVTAANERGDMEIAYATTHVRLEIGKVVLVPAGEYQMGCDTRNWSPYGAMDLAGNVWE
jgi:hypothetical protein